MDPAKHFHGTAPSVILIPVHRNSLVRLDYLFSFYRSVE